MPGDAPPALPLARVGVPSASGSGLLSLRRRGEGWSATGSDRAVAGDAGGDGKAVSSPSLAAPPVVCRVKLFK